MDLSTSKVETSSKHWFNHSSSIEELTILYLDIGFLHTLLKACYGDFCWVKMNLSNVFLGSPGSLDSGEGSVLFKLI